MEPVVSLNWYALGVLVLLHLVLGMVWYSPRLFGGLWRRDIGKAADYGPDGGSLARALVLNVVAAFFLAFVLATVFAMFTPATWLHDGRGLAWHTGLTGGFFTWLGFFLPVQLWMVGWEQRPWSYAAVTGGFHLVFLLLGGLILALWT